MSVYTTVTQDALTAFVKGYDIGQVHSLEGISDGIVNTNYFLTTDQGQFVLTLFERLTLKDVLFSLDLMHFLAEQGLPCASPVAGNNKRYVNELSSKPASIIKRMPGKSKYDVTDAHVKQIASAMGRWHKVINEFPQTRETQYNPRWRKTTAKAVLPKLDSDDADLLQEELRMQGLYHFDDLPNGVIHTDLFRDNALFEGSKLTGVIDVYDACTGPFLYDISVLINDWCRAEDGSIDPSLSSTFLTSYHKQRPLTVLEKGAWPMMLRRAALRFWLSRLWVKYNPRHGEISLHKDPSQYKNILKMCILEETILLDLWNI